MLTTRKEQLLQECHRQYTFRQRKQHIHKVKIKKKRLPRDFKGPYGSTYYVLGDLFSVEPNRKEFTTFKYGVDIFNIDWNKTKRISARRTNSRNYEGNMTNILLYSELLK